MFLPWTQHYFVIFRVLYGNFISYHSNESEYYSTGALLLLLQPIQLNFVTDSGYHEQRNERAFSVVNSAGHKNMTPLKTIARLSLLIFAGIDCFLFVPLIDFHSLSMEKQHFCGNYNHAGVQFLMWATLFRKQTNWIRLAHRASGLHQKWQCGVPSSYEEHQKINKNCNCDCRRRMDCVGPLDVAISTS